MDITVSVCTWNRSGLLKKALEEFTRLEAPPEIEWELLVVDNASTDDTRMVVESFSDRLPLRYTYEKELGLSNARNHAIAGARGNYIIWTDDDVLVDRRWLAAYARGFRVNSDADVFGGPIEPMFEVKPPGWMEKTWPSISRYHAIREIPAGSRIIDSRHLPNGANFAIRTSVQKENQYDASEGRKGDELFSGEEATIIRNILNSGGRGMWLPEAKVRHFLPASRMTLQYLRRTVRDSGKQRALREISEGRASEDVYFFGAPRWLWRKAAESYLAYGLQRLYADPERWIDTMLRAAWTWGTINGYRAGKH